MQSTPFHINNRTHYHWSRLLPVIVGVMLMSCVELQQDCFDTPPSFCNASRQFISFKTDGVRYRFCQPTFQETFTEGGESFFVINQFRRVPMQAAVKASFIVPNLFTFQVLVPADSAAYYNALGNHSLQLAAGDSSLFSGTIFYRQNCDLEYNSAYNGTETYHEIISVELIRSFSQGDSIISEFRMQGKFDTTLRGYPDSTQTTQLQEGKYDLLLWHVETP